MAARKRKIKHDEATKDKIQASQIINRFMAHLNGTVGLSPTQVSCGKALLNKVIPDLAAIQHSGDDENPVNIKVTIGGNA